MRDPKLVHILVYHLLEKIELFLDVTASFSADHQ